MRNTESGGNTDSTTSLSSRADCEVVPNGFSMTTRRHVAVALLGEPGAAQLLGDERERLRRDRQVERVVAHRAALAVELVEGLLEPVEGRVVVELALDEPDALRRAAARRPRRNVGARVLLDRVVHDLRRSPGPPSRGGRTRPARSRAAAGRGWRGRRPPA